MTIYELSGEYVEILEMLEDGDAEPEEVEERMKELNDSLDQKFDGYMRVYLQLDAEEEALEKEIKRLQAKKNHVSNGKERIKSTFQTVMLATGKNKINSELFSATIKDTAGKVIVDIQEDVPQEFWIQPDPEINKSKLKAYIKQNPNCEFAHIEKGKTIILK